MKVVITFDDNLDEKVKADLVNKLRVDVHAVTEESGTKFVIDIDDSLGEGGKTDLINLVWARASQITQGHFEITHDGGRSLSQAANDRWDEWSTFRWE